MPAFFYRPPRWDGLTESFESNEFPTSDWEYFYMYDNSQSAYLYTSGGIQAPTPSAGNYGRLLASGIYGGHTAGFKLINPAFLDLPNTKAIRMQGYFLPTNIGGFFGMTIKTSYGGGGYSLCIRSGVYPTFIPSIMFLDNFGNVTDLTSAFGGTVSLNAWYGFRIEVYPLGSSADRVICYKETVIGSNSWTIVNDVTFLSTSNSYAPWGSGRYMSFRSSEAGNGIVDLVSVTLGNAPPP